MCLVAMCLCLFPLQKRRFERVPVPRCSGGKYSRRERNIRKCMMSSYLVRYILMDVTPLAHFGGSNRHLYSNIIGTIEAGASNDLVSPQML